MDFEKEKANVNPPTEERLSKYVQVTEQLREGQFNVKVDVPLQIKDNIDRLGVALSQLGQSLSSRFDELEKITAITQKINFGILLDEVLNYIFDAFISIIPYDRIGFALIEDDPRLGRVVRAHWGKSNIPGKQKLAKGYTEKLAGSSLEKIILMGEPRIINDLVEYLAAHPNSLSTKLIVEDGVRSSLTCPIVALGNKVGFLFFSSIHLNTYKDLHQAIFKQIAGQVSTIVEKSRLYQKLLEAKEAKRQFHGFVCHDLRTPVGIVKTNLELLQSGVYGTPTSAMKKSFTMMNRATDQMLELLDNLLDVAAVESGKIQLNLAPEDLSKYLAEFNNYFEILLQPKLLSLLISVNPSLPLIVMDKNRINQILTNLVGNAIKFSPLEGIINITACRNKNNVEITISNSGAGIPEELHEKIFDEFENFKKVAGRYEKSFGLGLAIARKMAEIHGGSIEVKSADINKIKSRTSFVVTLPIAGP